MSFHAAITSIQHTQETRIPAASSLRMSDFAASLHAVPKFISTHVVTLTNVFNLTLDRY